MSEEETAGIIKEAEKTEKKYPFPPRAMTHLNKHQLCSIGLVTSGPNPDLHDIIEICVMPLDAQLKLYKKFMPYCLTFKPQRSNFEDITLSKAKLAKAHMNGMCPIDSIYLFQEWHKKMELGFNKKLVPLAFDWPFKRAFIQKWLGYHDFELLFNWQYRDLLPSTTFLNDRADFKCEKYPYNKHLLRWITTQLKVDFQNDDDAMDEALAVSECYVKILKESF